MARNQFQALFDALSDILPEGSEGVAKLTAPSLSQNADPEKKRDALKNALQELSTPDSEGSLDEAGVDEFVGFFKTLYGDDGNFRHMYSDVCAVMYGFLDTDKSLNREMPDEPIALANNMEIIVQRFNKLDESGLPAAKGVAKLQDHIELERTRMEYMFKQNEWQKGAFDKASQAIEEAKATADKLERSIEESKEANQKSLENTKREYITILGIFASIVISFSAGSAFTSSVLQSIDAVSFYRLCFITALIGAVLFNLIALLLSFVSSVSKIKDGVNLTRIAIIGNGILLIGMAAISVARLLNILNC